MKPGQSLLFRTATIVLAVFLIAGSAISHASETRPEGLDKTYNHDRWGTQPVDIERKFQAFTVSFDGADDSDGDAKSDALGVPEWVAQEVRAYKFEAGAKKCIPTKKERPSPWFTDRALVLQSVAPKDDSYRYSRAWRRIHPDWFVRGHLAMKFLAERMGHSAAWNTHTVLNAVPQRSKFNSGIWLDLEELTGAWAQRYSKVWIITGPIFVDRKPNAFIGQKGRFKVAVPEALFKIVAKENSEDAGKPDILAFIYPQIGAGYLTRRRGEYDHSRFLTSVEEIEELTGLSFFNNVPNIQRRRLRREVGPALWTVDQKDFIPACKGE